MGSFQVAAAPIRSEARAAHATRVRPAASGPLARYGKTATGILTRLSPAWFGWVEEKLLNPLSDFTQSFLKLRYPAPSCYGKAAEVAGTTYVVSWSGVGLNPCLQTTKEGGLMLTVHSNSPFVWRVVPRAGTGRKPTAPVNAAGVTTVCFTHTLVTKGPGPTQIITLNPFNAIGSLKPGFSTAAPSAGPLVDCQTEQGSWFAVTGGTHSCGSTADSAHACWAPDLSRPAGLHVLALADTTPRAQGDGPSLDQCAVGPLADRR